jgi:acyl-CoA thioester hydrolase
MAKPLGAEWSRSDTGHQPGAVHHYQLRVFYEDTDAAGIVYYANYLKFIERGRTEMMREAGLSHTRLMERYGIAFIVRRCNADFRAAARLDDLLEVRTRITALGGASIEAEQVVWHGQDTLVRVEVKLGCIDRNGRPVRLPEEVRAALARYQPRDGKS